MYIAQRELKTCDKQGRVTVYKPGDPIPDFEKWDEVPKRAHLSMEWVVKSEQTVKLPIPNAQNTQNLTKDAQKVSAPDLFNKCPHCPDKEFKNARALKIHITVAHKK